MYELLIVSKINDTDGLLSRVEKMLKDASAVDLKMDKLGKKQLAYPIKKQTEADYAVLTFGAEGTVIGNLTDMLRLEQESLLRYLIIKQKARKASKRKRVVVEEVKEEKTPKVTVITKPSSAKATEGKKVTNESKVSKVSEKKVSKETKVAKVKAKAKKK